MVVLLALEDVGDHFAHPWGWWTWSMPQDGCYLWRKMDYVLAQEISDFRLWATKIPQVCIDHHAIIAQMTLDRLYAHHRYTTCWQKLPDFPLQEPLLENDIRFQHLKEYRDEIPDIWQQHERSWISKLTWSLINKQLFAVRWHCSLEVIQNYSS
jgi:hypothetical protein